MSTRTTLASIVAGAVIALGAGIPSPAGDCTVVSHNDASAHVAQALNALNTRMNAEAAAYKASLAQLAEARAIGALDARWNAEVKAYKVRLSAALALKALDARWNAEALFFGLR